VLIAQLVTMIEGYVKETEILKLYVSLEFL